MNMESSLLKKPIGAIVAELEKYFHLLKEQVANLQKTLPLGQVVRQPSPERQALIESLKRFLDDRPLLNFIKGAVDKSFHTRPASCDECTQRTHLFWEFSKNADLLYAQFCRGQQRMDSQFFVRQVETFLRETVQNLIENLRQHYTGLMHEIVQADTTIVPNHLP
jgi:hypothetical protein